MIDRQFEDLATRSNAQAGRVDAGAVDRRDASRHLRTMFAARLFAE
jgi:hypothetical protein